MADDKSAGSKAAEIFGSDRMWGLKELALPDPVSYWPQTPGWYGLGMIVLLGLSYAAYRFWRRRRANQYRRDGIEALDRMLNDAAGVNQLPFLLRKAALTAYPRAEVSPLRGRDWVEWLNGSAGRVIFHIEDADLLDELAYAPSAPADAEPERVRHLIEAGRLWMRSHRASI